MIHLTGDINLTDWYFNQGFGMGTNIKKGLDPFRHLDRSNGDIWIGNFEGTASTVSNNEKADASVFCIAPDVLRPLKHFDFYSLANNHAMQHGKKAFEETVESLESYGSKVFGTKKNKSLTFEHNGRLVSITGLCLRVDVFSDNPEYWYNPEYNEIEEENSLLPKEAFKILYIHWGNEYINRPSTIQKKFAHWLIDIGFDLIVGMHSHVLQGYEDYHNKRIYYSLGNFVFDMASEPCKIGAFVNLEFKAEQPFYTESYIHIDKDGCPKIVADSSIPDNWRFNYLNEQLLKDENSEEYHHEINKGYKFYREENHKHIFRNILNHPVSSIRIVVDFIKRRIG